MLNIVLLLSVVLSAPVCPPRWGKCPAFKFFDEWNQPIDNDPVDYRSSCIIENMKGNLVLDFGQEPADGKGMVYTMSSFGTGDSHATPIHFRTPEGREASKWFFGNEITDAECSVSGCKDDTFMPWKGVAVEGWRGRPSLDPTSGNRHVIVADVSRCILSEGFNVSRTEFGVEATRAMVWGLDTRKGDGRASADSSGMAILPGILKYNEIARGLISHALRITASNSSMAFVGAASQPGTTPDPRLPPHGARFRLKKSFPLPPTLSPDAQVVLTAMRDYGLMYAGEDARAGIHITCGSDPRFRVIFAEIERISFDTNNFEMTQPPTDISYGWNVTKGVKCAGRTSNNQTVTRPAKFNCATQDGFTSDLVLSGQNETWVSVTVQAVAGNRVRCVAIPSNDTRVPTPDEISTAPGGAEVQNTTGDPQTLVILGLRPATSYSVWCGLKETLMLMHVPTLELRMVATTPPTFAPVISNAAAENDVYCTPQSDFYCDGVPSDYMLIFDGIYVVLFFSALWRFFALKPGLMKCRRDHWQHLLVAAACLLRLAVDVTRYSMVRVQLGGVLPRVYRTIMVVVVLVLQVIVVRLMLSRWTPLLLTIPRKIMRCVNAVVIFYVFAGVAFGAVLYYIKSTVIFLIPPAFGVLQLLLLTFSLCAYRREKKIKTRRSKPPPNTMVNIVILLLCAQTGVLAYAFIMTQDRFINTFILAAIDVLVWGCVLIFYIYRPQTFGMVRRAKKGPKFMWTLKPTTTNADAGPRSGKWFNDYAHTNNIQDVFTPSMINNMSISDLCIAWPILTAYAEEQKRIAPEKVLELERALDARDSAALVQAASYVSAGSVLERFFRNVRDFPTLYHPFSPDRQILAFRRIHKFTKSHKKPIVICFVENNRGSLASMSPSGSISSNNQPNLCTLKDHVCGCIQDDEKVEILREEEKHEGGSSGTPCIIIKKGDDLRHDVACQLIFRLLNSILAKDPSLRKLKIAVYQCLSLTDTDQLERKGEEEFGCLEFVQGLRSISDMDKREPFSAQNLARSAAPAFIAAYILGVRDRHFDNIQVKRDGTMVLVDFGRILGDQCLLDTGSFAVTTELFKALEKESIWDVFVEDAAAAFMAFRKESEKIIRLTSLLLNFYNSEDVRTFISTRLCLDIEDANVVQDIIRAKLYNAPGNLKTRAKNTMHAFATCCCSTIKKPQRQNSEIDLEAAVLLNRSGLSILVVVASFWRFFSATWLCGSRPFKSFRIQGELVFHALFAPSPNSFSLSMTALDSSSLF